MATFFDALMYRMRSDALYSRQCARGAQCSPSRTSSSIDCSEMHEFSVSIPSVSSQQAIRDMLGVGAYSKVDPRFVAALDQFQFGQGSPRITGSAPATATVVAFRADPYDTIYKTPQQYRSSLGFGPISLQHFLAVGAQYPNAQYHWSMINVDDVLAVEGRRYVASLWGYWSEDYSDIRPRGVEMLNHQDGWYKRGSWYLGLKPPPQSL